MRFSKQLKFGMLGFALLTLALIAYLLLSGGRDDADSESELARDGLISTSGPVSVDAQQTQPPTDGSVSPDEQSTTSQSKGVNGEGVPRSDATAPPHPLDPLLELAHEIKAHIEQDIADYTATLIKRERIKGGLGPENKMAIKIRNRNAATGVPLSAYIQFLEPKSVKGREVIWVENENGNKLISHEAGLLNLKRFNLAPDSMLAMAGNKYPITEVGLLRLAEKLIEKGERDRAVGLCQVDVLENQRVGEVTCRLYQITHPEPEGKFDFHIAQIFVDMERKIPLRYAAFLWPKGNEAPPLEEEYTYLDLQLNVGLTSQDFDPDNPDYKFPSF